MANQKAYEILKFHFEKEKSKGRKLSIRSLAKTLDLSSSYVGHILTGKKKLPEDRVDDFVNELKIDETGRRELLQAILLEKSITQELQESLEENFITNPFKKQSGKKYEQSNSTPQALLSDWYYIPLIVLLGHPQFKADAQWISTQLGLKESVADKAWKRLVQLEIVKLEEGQWVKQAKNLRLATTQSSSEVRTYHSYMLKAAHAHLNQKTDQQSFENRLITGGTVLTKKENIKKARAYIDEAVYKTMDILTEGEDCTEVYQVATQLFPIKS